MCLVVLFSFVDNNAGKHAGKCSMQVSQGRPSPSERSAEEGCGEEDLVAALAESYSSGGAGAYCTGHPAGGLDSSPHPLAQLCNLAGLGLFRGGALFSQPAQRPGC